MSDAARRKERKRLKRDKAKADRRKALAVSPYKRLGSAGEIEACYINADWQSSGIASIQCIRINPTAGFAMAGFLIDLWCAGLKDAWGHLNLFQQDIDHNLEVARRQYQLIRIQPDAARSLVAGAIRFARQNGFRLPPKYQRWVNLLGQVPDPAAADLRPFGKDGGLLWVGPLDDLRKRLVGSSLEQFLDRPDVKFVSPDPEWEYDDEYDDEYGDDPLDDDFEDDEQQDDRAPVEIAADLMAMNVVESFVEETFEEALEAARRTGEEPSPLLRDAAKTLLKAVLTEMTAIEKGPEVTEEVTALLHDAQSRYVPAFQDAIHQLERLLPEGPTWLKTPLPPGESQTVLVSPD
jgi:hypothetical protein